MGKENSVDSTLWKRISRLKRCHTHRKVFSLWFGARQQARWPSRIPCFCHYPVLPSYIFFLIYMKKVLGWCLSAMVPSTIRLSESITRALLQGSSQSRRDSWSKKLTTLFPCCVPLCSPAVFPFVPPRAV